MAKIITLSARPGRDLRGLANSSYISVRRLVRHTVSLTPNFSQVVQAWRDTRTVLPVCRLSFVDQQETVETVT